MRRAYHLSLILVLASTAGCSDVTGSPTSPRSATTAAALTTSGTTDIPVATTLYDADTSRALLLTRSDDYNGSDFATYSPVGGVRSSLTSHITASGGWQLYIGNQTARTLHLMLADAGLPFPNGYYWSSVEVGSRCVDSAGNQLSFLLLAVGASYDNCMLIVDFDYGTKKATTYKLAMGPAFANTGRALVTCTAAASGSCTSWTIEPNDAAPNARVAILTAGNGTTSLDGKFYTNSYRIAAAKQRWAHSRH